MKKNNLEIALNVLSKPEGHTTVLRYDDDYIVFKCNKCNRIYKRHKSYIVRKYEVLNEVSMCSHCHSNRKGVRTQNFQNPEEVFYQTHSRDEYQVLGVKYDSNKKKCLEIKHLCCGSTYLSTCYSAYNSNCPNCKRLSKTNNLLTKKPKLVEKFWDYEKNEISPENVTPNSNKLIHIKCKDCGTESLIPVKELKVVCTHCRKAKQQAKSEMTKENDLIKMARKSFDELVIKTLKKEESNVLTEKERRFLTLFFEFNLPMNVIGQNEGITRERVRQILLEALDKINLSFKYKEIYTNTNLKIK